MGIENKQQSTHSKRDDTFAPIKTLAQFDSAVRVGTLVWGKLGDWPWWPGKYLLLLDGRKRASVSVIERFLPHI